MTDTSLDDFFAKKDKSKRKNKAAAAAALSTTTTTAVTTTTTTAAAAAATTAGANEQQQQQQTKKSVGFSTNEDNNSGERDQRPSGGGGGGGGTTGTGGGGPPTDRPNNAELKTSKGKPEEDEWREIEEEAKDYSGLKIQNLQISDLRDEEQERIRAEDYSEDADQMRLKESSGPWNKTGLAPAAAQPPPVVEVSVPKVVEEVEPVEEPKTTKGAYVPPAMRSGGAASYPSGGSSASSKSKGQKFAPKLDSEEHFPSLSAATDVRPVKKGDISPVDVGFEAVKRGSRIVVDDPSNRGPKLTLGNKFDALSRGGSS